MKILFVASEAAPFAKTGGLADVTGSLPKELKRLGHDVRIIIPFYKVVERGGFSVRKLRKSLSVVMGGTLHKGLLHQTLLDDIPVYFLESRGYFHRDYLYGTPAGDYPDNHLRFAFFCRGVLEALRGLDFRPDAIHCHDWQTALVPILLKYELPEDPFFAKTAVLFTIHNLAYQGLFPRESLVEMGLDDSLFSIERLEYYGKVNLMKGAILTADLINTVSESYCREIRTPEQGCGLEGVLNVRRDDLSGVLNGLDYTEWDPATDRDIFGNYTASSLHGKAVNKRELQRVLGLEQRADIPLLGMVSRLAAQKGFDLLAEILPRLAAKNLQLVVLGDGEEKYRRLLTRVCGKRRENCAFHFGFDPALARQIYAGCDMFLMPSHYEPCGLGQLIALRYGAVPVVRKTGGLADTVIDARESAEGWTGFTFTEYSPAALSEAIGRAERDWRADREAWEMAVRRGMDSDFSWRRSAERYLELYRRGVEKRGVE